MQPMTDHMTWEAANTTYSTITGNQIQNNFLKPLVCAECNNQQTAIFDVHHEKTDLKVFVVVIPKEGWARVAAPILLLV